MRHLPERPRRSSSDPCQASVEVASAAVARWCRRLVLAGAACGGGLVLTVLNPASSAHAYEMADFAPDAEFSFDSSVDLRSIEIGASETTRYPVDTWDITDFGIDTLDTFDFAAVPVDLTSAWRPVSPVLAVDVPVPAEPVEQTKALDTEPGDDRSDADVAPAAHVTQPPFTPPPVASDPVGTPGVSILEDTSVAVPDTTVGVDPDTEPLPSDEVHPTGAVQTDTNPPSVDALTPPASSIPATSPGTGNPSTESVFPHGIDNLGSVPLVVASLTGSDSPKPGELDYNLLNPNTDLEFLVSDWVLTEAVTRENKVKTAYEVQDLQALTAEMRYVRAVEEVGRASAAAGQDLSSVAELVEAANSKLAADVELTVAAENLMCAEIATANCASRAYAAGRRRLELPSLVDLATAPGEFGFGIQHVEGSTAGGFELTPVDDLAQTVAAYYMGVPSADVLISVLNPIGDAVDPVNLVMASDAWLDCRPACGSQFDEWGYPLLGTEVLEQTYGPGLDLDSPYDVTGVLQNGERAIVSLSSVDAGGFPREYYMNVNKDGNGVVTVFNWGIPFPRADMTHMDAVLYRTASAPPPATAGGSGQSGSGGPGPAPAPAGVPGVITSGGDTIGLQSRWPHEIVSISPSSFDVMAEYRPMDPEQDGRDFSALDVRLDWSFTRDPEAQGRQHDAEQLAAARYRHLAEQHMEASETYREAVADQMLTPGEAAAAVQAAHDEEERLLAAKAVAYDEWFRAGQVVDLAQHRRFFGDRSATMSPRLQELALQTPSSGLIFGVHAVDFSTAPDITLTPVSNLQDLFPFVEDIEKLRRSLAPIGTATSVDNWALACCAWASGAPAAGAQYNRYAGGPQHLTVEELAAVFGDPVPLVSIAELGDRLTVPGSSGLLYGETATPDTSRVTVHMIPVFNRGGTVVLVNLYGTPGLFGQTGPSMDMSDLMFYPSPNGPDAVGDDSGVPPATDPGDALPPGTEAAQPPPADVGRSSGGERVGPEDMLQGRDQSVWSPTFPPDVRTSVEVESVPGAADPALEFTREGIAVGDLNFPLVLSNPGGVPWGVSDLFTFPLAPEAGEVDVAGVVSGRSSGVEFGAAPVPAGPEVTGAGVSQPSVVSGVVVGGDGVAVRLADVAREKAWWLKQGVPLTDAETVYASQLYSRWSIPLPEALALVGGGVVDQEALRRKIQGGPSGQAASVTTPWLAPSPVSSSASSGFVPEQHPATAYFEGQEKRAAAEARVVVPVAPSTAGPVPRSGVTTPPVSAVPSSSQGPVVTPGEGTLIPTTSITGQWWTSTSTWFSRGVTAAADVVTEQTRAWEMSPSSVVSITGSTLGPDTYRVRLNNGTVAEYDKTGTLVSGPGTRGVPAFIPPAQLTQLFTTYMNRTPYPSFLKPGPGPALPPRLPNMRVPAMH